MDDNTNSDPVTIEQALDQIQNWINSGNADMAREGLQEVLAMEPANSRALDLQTQLSNLSAAAPMQAPTMSDTPNPMSDDIQIGGLGGEAVTPAADPTPVTPMETPVVMSAEPIDLGYSPPTETPAPGIDFSEPVTFDTANQPEASPVTFDAVSEPEPSPAPSIDFSQPETEPASTSPSFEIPSTPPTDDIPAETPSSPFSASVTEGLSQETTPAMETQPQLDATDKKAILMKALIPLGIAIILGVGIYFAYQYFSGDDSENTNTETPTNDIVTQPDTSEDVKDNDADSDSTDTDAETDSDTSDTDADTDSASDSDSSDTDLETDADSDTTIKDGKGETDTETKIKVKRPVKKATL